MGAINGWFNGIMAYRTRIIALVSIVSSLWLPSIANAGAHWQTPVFTRTNVPEEYAMNPITLDAAFDDYSGCPYNQYQFGSYAGSWTYIGTISGPTAHGYVFTGDLTVGYEYTDIRLLCMVGPGSIYDATGNLLYCEGSPCFFTVTAAILSPTPTTTLAIVSMGTSLWNMVNDNLWLIVGIFAALGIVFWTFNRIKIWRR